MASTRLLRRLAWPESPLRSGNCAMSLSMPSLIFRFCSGDVDGFGERQRPKDFTGCELTTMDVAFVLGVSVLGPRLDDDVLRRDIDSVMSLASTPGSAADDNERAVLFAQLHCRFPHHFSFRTQRSPRRRPSRRDSETSCTRRGRCVGPTPEVDRRWNVFWSLRRWPWILSSIGASAIVALRLHVRTGACAPQELTGFECLQDCLAHRGVKIPQPLHLRFGEVETWNLVVSGANESDSISHRVLARQSRRQPVDNVDRAEGSPRSIDWMSPSERRSITILMFLWLSIG